MPPYSWHCAPMVYLGRAVPCNVLPLTCPHPALSSTHDLTLGRARAYARLGSHARFDTHALPPRSHPCRALGCARDETRPSYRVWWPEIDLASPKGLILQSPAREVLRLDPLSMFWNKAKRRPSKNIRQGRKGRKSSLSALWNEKEILFR